MILRFAEAYTRWNEHRGGELHEDCPGCGRLVVVKSRVGLGEAGEFDVAHAQPACAEFLTVFEAMGAYNYRETVRATG